MYIFLSELTAAIAEAAIRQSPYYPIGLETVCNGITEIIENDDEGIYGKKVSIESDIMLGMTEQQLSDSIDLLDRFDDFTNWNLSKREREKGVLVNDESRPKFTFSSRYDGPTKENDFVDLDALKRNVYNRIVNNHHSFMADEAKFANEVYRDGGEEYFGKPALEQINKLIKDTVALDKGEISDGYHSFDELYKHRNRLFIGLCKMALCAIDESPWISKNHSDGKPAFGGGWFVLGMFTTNGQQITYHLPESYWNECEQFCTVLEQAPEWDGHTPADVLERLAHQF